MIVFCSRNIVLPLNPETSTKDNESGTFCFPPISHFALREIGHFFQNIYIIPKDRTLSAQDVALQQALYLSFQ